jgi:two-component system chemotaxis response regulator CheB
MEQTFQAIVVAVSTGGVSALKFLVNALPAGYRLPLLVVQHVSPAAMDGPANLLDQMGNLRVKEADEGETLAPGSVYLAPANYHLLVERDCRLALSTDPPVNFARPSADVLFETAADAFGRELIGIVLTGGGSDGSVGLQRIKERGGITIVQKPEDAEADSMPRNAIAAAAPDHVVALTDLPELLLRLAGYVRGDERKMGEHHG